MTLAVLDNSSEMFSRSTYKAARWEDAAVRTFEVRAVKGQGGVWATVSRDIPGLNLEACSLVDLFSEIREWAPDLLQDNHVIKAGERFAIVVHSSGTPTRIYS